MGSPQFSHQDWLENAARQVDKQLQDDRSYQELSDQLKVPIHSKIVFGLYDTYLKSKSENMFLIALIFLVFSCFSLIYSMCKAPPRFTDQPSLSGLNELDYPSLPEAGISIENLCEICNVKRVPLPPELVEQFERILNQTTYTHTM